ncbi:SWIM zinc finger family protein [Nonomuraea sp. NPDC050310]|uniref:SWIM zinc finger family protein n=1 Tax=Nonomuraea sp. NPDC050310 TaxID=3154935 RepID=UPI0033FC4425
MTSGGPGGWGRPVRVEGGLKARSRRGSIGSAWWSRRFIDILERVCDKGRLSRGRAYARAGQVLHLDLSPGLVAARVQGSRREPYEVEVGIEAYGEQRWAELQAAMSAQAVHRARLLAGEMPEEIEEVFAARGVDLFPRDLDMRCSCPDWGLPCKHLSAVLYLLAESFDEDPFLVLAWRGRGRDQLLSELDAVPGPPSDPDLVEDVPFAERLGDFFASGATVHRPERRGTPPPGLLLRLHPAPDGLTAELTAAYTAFAES